jgi:hypothetical protein
MLVEKATGGSLGDLGSGNGGALRPQPVAEVLGSTEGGADELSGVTAANEEPSERVKEGAEGVGAETLDVVSVPEERIEHDRLPSKEREVPRRASGLCGVVSARRHHRQREMCKKELARWLELRIIGNSA